MGVLEIIGQAVADDLFSLHQKKMLVYFKHYDLFPKIKERLPGGIFRL